MKRTNRAPVSAIRSVRVECSSCYGTGLYQGMCEAKGEAVICLGCAGTGCEVLRYRPFVRRRGKRGIKSVRLSRGQSLAAGVGGHGPSITYAEFAAGKMPKA